MLNWYGNLMHKTCKAVSEAADIVHFETQLAQTRLRIAQLKRYERQLAAMEKADNVRSID